MAQINLGGESVDVAEEKSRAQAHREWVEDQIAELQFIRDHIDYFENLSNEPRDEYGHQPFELEQVMGAWWYCNHIVGWDNNIPYKDPSKEFSPMDYDGVPQCDVMANSCRDCFLAVRRDEVAWDKEHAIRRLNKAIEEYEKELVKPLEEKMDTESGWSIEEVESYDEEDELEVEAEDREDMDKVIRGRPNRAIIDRSQTKLGGW